MYYLWHVTREATPQTPVVEPLTMENPGPTEPGGRKPLGKPSTLTTTPGDHQVVLSWEAPSIDASNITGYQYQYRTTNSEFSDTWTTVSGGENILEVIIFNLTNGTTYTFRVRAMNSYGFGPVSTEISATPYDESMAQPGAPPNLEAISGNRQVTLSWEASRIGASKITGYQYQHSLTSNGFDDTWTDVPNWESALEVTIRNLIGATTHYFRVRAVNADGNGHSTEISIIIYDGPTPEPGQPTNLAVTSGDRQVTLNWTAPTTVGASEITHYEYHQSLTSEAPSGTWTPISGGRVVRRFIVSNLSGATTYFFHVRAVNSSHGAGPTSTEAEVIAYDGPTPEPGVPPTLTAISGDRRVTLGWTAPTTVGASEITHYEYRQSTTSGVFGDTWTLVSGGGSALEVIVSNLSSVTTYFFHVRAVNNHGNGAASTEVEVIAYDGPTPGPGAPPALTATSGDRQVTLGWTAPTTVGASAITHYEYHQSLTSGAPSGTWTLVSGGGSALEVTIRNLIGATTYFFHVRAVNNHGNGAASTEVEVIAYDGPTPEPGTPPTLTATSGDRQVTLDWTAPTTGVSAITHYEYHQSLTSGAPSGTWTLVSGGGSALEVIVSQPEWCHHLLLPRASGEQPWEWGGLHRS